MELGYYFEFIKTSLTFHFSFFRFCQCIRLPFRIGVVIDMANVHVHHDMLKKLCRLCGQSMKRRHDVLKSKAHDIKLSLKIDVSRDVPGVHPPYMCSCCVLKLKRWRDRKNKKKEVGVVNIDVVNWSPHCNACTICQRSSSMQTTETPADAAKKVANKIGLVSWQDNGAHIFLKNGRVGEHVFVERSLVLNSDCTWSGQVNGQSLDKSLLSSPDTVTSAEEACKLMQDFFGQELCNGNLGFGDVVGDRCTLKGVHNERDLFSNSFLICLRF